MVRYASSIKHGGMQVEASECDHSSYVKLGLCCPFCGNPVFLSKGRDFKGSKKRKAYKTAAYFCHFKGVNASECELRSTTEGKARYTESRAKAKQQRLSKFRSAIALIWQLNPKCHNWEITRTTAYQVYCLDNPAKRWKGFLQKKAAKLGNLRLKINQELSNCLGFLPDYLVDAYLDHLDYLRESELELKLHRQICYEVLNYLLSPGGKEDLLDLMTVLIFEMVFIEDLVYENRHLFEEDQSRTLGIQVLLRGVFGLAGYPRLNEIIKLKVNWEAVSEQGMIRNLVEYLITTPWASGFELLEDKTKMSSAALELTGILVINYHKDSFAHPVVLTDNLIKFGNIDFADWWRDIWLNSAYRKLYNSKISGNKLIIKQPLPGVLQAIKVFAEIVEPQKMYCGQVSQIVLVRDKVVAQGEFWLRLDDPAFKKQFKKKIKSPLELEYTCNTPGLYIDPIGGEKEKSLLSSLVVAFFATLNLPLEAKINYLLAD